MHVYCFCSILNTYVLFLFYYDLFYQYKHGQTYAAVNKSDVWGHIFTVFAFAPQFRFNHQNMRCMVKYNKTLWYLLNKIIWQEGKLQATIE